MSRLITFLLIGALCPVFSFAQTGKLTGTVRDSVGNPLEDATVLIKETNNRSFGECTR